jgi:hypothetical protein
MAGLFDLGPTSPRQSKRTPQDDAPLSLPLRGGANPARRSLGRGVGIHYTDTATIMKIVETVVLRPLRASWEEVKEKIRLLKRPSAKDSLYYAFREQLGAFRVLDPACGSGNFLYLVLRHLKDFDRRVEEEAKALGVASDTKGQRVTPQSVLGIEVNPYAAELARVTVWIGELQWQLRNGYGIRRQPILGALNGIENRDALLNVDGSEASWPRATVIIGNPPFLGDKKMIGELGEDYVLQLRSCYKGRVPGGADLVCYWFAKCADLMKKKKIDGGGLVSTQSIRRGTNRTVIEAISAAGKITSAWSDEPWVLDGAAVRVSLISFSTRSERELVELNGSLVSHINSDLTSHTDTTAVNDIGENQGIAFIGSQKGGPLRSLENKRGDGSRCR